MSENGMSVQPKPFHIKTVRGEAYHVGGRKLTPVARVVTFGKARATVGTGGISGFGAGLVHITPMAMLEETAGGERRIPLRASDSTAVWGMVGAVTAITLVCTVVRWLVHCRR